jgi:hypothetical protein
VTNQLPNGSTADAPLPGSSSIDPGEKVFRQAYREGHEAGVRRGTAAYLNNPMMEDMALELTLLRAMVAAMTIEAERHEKLIEHYRIILGVK